MGIQSVRAMILNYHYHHTFVHDLEALKNDPFLGEWWDGLSNGERTYVLKGNQEGRKK